MIFPVSQSGFLEFNNREWYIGSVLVRDDDVGFFHLSAEVDRVLECYPVFCISVLLDQAGRVKLAHNLFRFELDVSISDYTFHIWCFFVSVGPEEYSFAKVLDFVRIEQRQMVSAALNYVM